MTTIPYKKGYKVKPSAISSVGQVTFTDGTNDIIPNQKQCEAYGYTYDITTGTCSAFPYSANLNKNINHILEDLQRLQENGYHPSSLQRD